MDSNQPYRLQWACKHVPSKRSLRDTAQHQPLPAPHARTTGQILYDERSGNREAGQLQSRGIQVSMPVLAILPEYPDQIRSRLRQVGERGQIDIYLMKFLLRRLHHKRN